MGKLSDQHGDEPSDTPLFLKVEFVEYILKEGHELHVCRGHDGNLYLYSDTDQVAELTREEVAWLARVLVAALDNWPDKG